MAMLMEKIKKIIKISILLIIGIIIINKTWYFFDTLVIAYKHNWLFQKIYPITEFGYDLIDVLAFYLSFILAILYFFYKNKIKKNNDFIQGVRYLGILIGIGLIIYTSYLTIYDIRNLLFIKEEVLYGDTIFNIGFTSIFVYLTWNLKKYLFEDKKLSKGLFIVSGVLIIVGLLINMYLVSIY